MNYMLLVNVLEYFDRENLEKLSIVSRLFEKIVRKEFPKHPFRVFQEFHIAPGTNGSIRLGMMHDGNTLTITSITPPSANVAEFKSGLNEGFRHDVRYFSVRAMLPFMGKSIRFRKTIIELNSTLISQQSITDMENIAHIWTGRILEIQPGYDVITPSSPDDFPSSDYEDEPYVRFAPEEAVIPSCDRIFSSPGVITPFHKLELNSIDIPLNVYPALYAVKIIRISEMRKFSAANVLNFVEGLSRYNSITILICFSCRGMDFQRTHIGEIREAFSNANETHAWKLIVIDAQFDTEKLIEFRDENLLTKDVLKFRLNDKRQKKEFCDSLGIYFFNDLWVLERKPL